MAKEISLPKITSQLKADAPVMVSVSEHKVMVDGSEVQDVQDMLRLPGNNVPALEDKMEEKRRKIEEGGGHFDGLVNFQVDKAVEFKVLKKVMFGCNAAGFGFIKFVGNKQSVAKPAEGVKSASNP